MRIGRAMIAAALAVAVVLLPASGGAAFAVQTDPPHRHHGRIAAAAAPDADHPTAREHDGDAVDDCASIAVCTLKCFTYTGTGLPALAASFTAAQLAIPVTAGDRDTRGSVPPFRPPRA